MTQPERPHMTRRKALRRLGLVTSGVLLGCASSEKSLGEDSSLPPSPDAGPLPLEDASAGDAASRADAGAAQCEATRRDARGPFFAPNAPTRTRIAEPSEPGMRIFLQGTVQQSDCETPVEGALLDVWQADAMGQYHDAGQTSFRLRGQVLSDADGRWQLETIMPGHYENGPGAWRPAHLHFTVSAPGFASVTTQLYFAGDPYLAPNDGCPTACDSSDPDRIITLEPGEGGSHGVWRVVLARAGT